MRFAAMMVREGDIDERADADAGHDEVEEDVDPGAQLAHPGEMLGKLVAVSPSSEQGVYRS